MDDSMSHDWSHIQSFFNDQDILKAITDLSIAIKQELAGLHIPQSPRNTQKAKFTIKEFLFCLQETLSEQKKGIVFGIDSRSNELVSNFVNARKDTKNYNSILMRGGPASTVSLLEAEDSQSKRELIKSLSELRKIVSYHQHENASTIFEEF